MCTLSARTYNRQQVGGVRPLCRATPRCRVQVNTEQVSFEAFVGAGEGLCGPDISRELVPPLRPHNREEILMIDDLVLAMVVPDVQLK